MQRLAGQESEAVVHKLLVAREYSALYYAVTTISGIIEKRVADVFHVHTYLVGTARLQPQLHQRDVVEPLQHAIVGDGILAIVAIRKGIHDLAEAEIAANIDMYSAFVICEVAPYKRHVAAVYRVL